MTLATVATRLTRWKKFCLFCRVRGYRRADKLAGSRKAGGDGGGKTECKRATEQDLYQHTKAVEALRERIDLAEAKIAGAVNVTPDTNQEITLT